jgi:signal transduction histidine kinase
LREGISIGLGDGAVLLGRQGKRAPIQGSASPVQDGSTNAVGVCLLFRAASQRARDEEWGAPEHGSASRMEILGHLTAAVAQTFTRLLEANKGRTRAARLANRLLEFGQRQPASETDLDLNNLLRSLEDLLQCALGDEIALDMALDPAAGRAKGDPGQVELLLMHLAISACTSAIPGPFSIETSVADSQAAGDSYAVIAVRPPGGSVNAATDMPALDEILRQSAGEIRVTSDGGVVRIYLPSANQEGGL